MSEDRKKQNAQRFLSSFAKRPQVPVPRLVRALNEAGETKAETEVNGQRVKVEIIGDA